MSIAKTKDEYVRLILMQKQITDECSVRATKPVVPSCFVSGLQVMQLSMIIDILTVAHLLRLNFLHRLSSVQNAR